MTREHAYPLSPPSVGFMTPATALALWFGLAGPMLVIAPLGTAPLAFLFIVATIVLARLRDKAWPTPSRTALILAVAIAGWSAASAFWAFSPHEVFAKAADLTVLLIGSVFVSAVKLDDGERRKVERALLLGTAIALALFALQSVLAMPLAQVYSSRSLHFSFANRAADALPLLLWPTALVLWRQGRHRLAVAMLVLFALLTPLTESASSRLSSVVALVVFALVSVMPNALRRLPVLLVVLAVLLCVPLARMADRAGLADQEHLFTSARHRVEIWGFAAQKFLDRPVLGWGLNNSRVVPNEGAVSRFQAPDKPVLTLHPHDGWLQVLLELGIVGGALILAAGVALTTRLANFAADTRRFAIPAFCVAFVVASLAFGAWQSWWMAMLATGALAFQKLDKAA
jgi:exopolysaccharide production protein ExoQ